VSDYSEFVRFVPVLSGTQHKKKTPPNKKSAYLEALKNANAF